MSSTISDPIEEAQQEVKQLLELRELDLAYIANLEGSNESLSKQKAILASEAALLREALTPARELVTRLKAAGYFDEENEDDPFSKRECPFSGYDMCWEIFDPYNSWDCDTCVLEQLMQKTKALGE